MCGFVGILYDRETDVPTGLVRRLTDRIAHRGPDDQGVLVLNGEGIRVSDQPMEPGRAALVLIHRRLSILELSKAGWQPMQSEDSDRAIVFNGEIYNYIELREQLKSLGIATKSGSDTEVLMHACAAWGRDALPRLVGMFSFALADAKRRTLLLARDFFGIKPLYLARFDGGLAFGSEIKALLEIPGVGRRADPERIYTYLRYGITDFGDRTLFETIRQLPPGHSLELSLDGPSSAGPVSYWVPPSAEPRGDLSFEQAAAKLRELFLDSVRLHMRSDVPVGSALSGGIDSSAIVMAMRRIDPKARIHVFGYVADEAAVNEERWMDLVAEAAGATMHKVRLEPEDLARDLDTMVQVQDEPFLSTSIYAQYRIFKEAKAAGITVMLDGQGGDELLAGYDQYLGYRAATLIRQGRWKSAYRLLKGMSGFGRRMRTFKRVGEVLAPGMLQNTLRKMAGEELMPDWMNPAWFRDRGITGRSLRSAADDLSMSGELRRTLTHTTLPMLLRFEDRNSMAHSIESRVPFLTSSLAEFVASLPEDYLLSPEGLTKSVFREAMKGIVPEAILARRDKVGFETPQRKWVDLFRSRMVGRVPSLDTGILAPKAVDALWDRVQKGDPKAPYALWRCLSVELWAATYRVDFGT